MTPRSHDTRTRILQAAKELFAEQGVRETALWQIADRLNMTKPALYYYFASREDLINSLVQPVIADTEQALAAVEAETDLTTADILERYYDLSVKHIDINLLILRDLSLFTGTDLGKRVAVWRHRFTALLVGPDADLAARVRAVIALGGIADCTVMFTDADPAELKAVALTTALTALGEAVLVCRSRWRVDRRAGPVSLRPQPRNRGEARPPNGQRHRRR